MIDAVFGSLLLEACASAEMFPTIDSSLQLFIYFFYSH